MTQTAAELLHGLGHDVPVAEASAQPEQDDGKSNAKPRPAEQLVALARSITELFRTPEGQAYASFPVNGHWETWPLYSREFRGFLGRHFAHMKDGRPPSRSTLDDAITHLEALLLESATERPVHTRVAACAGSL